MKNSVRSRDLSLIALVTVVAASLSFSSRAHAEESAPEETPTELSTPEAEGTTAPDRSSDSVEGTEVTPPTTPEKDTPTEPAPSNADHGLFGPVQVGVMAAAAFPGLTHYSIESRLFKSFGLSVGMGGLSTKSGDVEFETQHWDIRGRWFPFSASFFLGAALGSTEYTGKLKKDIDFAFGGSTKTVPTTFEGGIERTELTPMLGWQWITSIGFTVGLDFGYQMTMSSSSSVDVTPEGLSDTETAAIKDLEDYKKSEKQLKDDFLDVFKDKGLPNVTFGLGWML